MKKYCFMLLTCLLLAGFIPCTANAGKRINVVKCDGEIISSDSMYAIEKNNGIVIIPYKLLSNAPITKVSAKWKESKKYLTVERNNIVLEIYGGKKQYTKNNEFKYNLATPVAYHEINGKRQVWIPAKTICNLLGFSYYYNSAKKTLVLKSKKFTDPYKSTMTTKPFLLMDTEEFIKAIGPIARKEYRKSGMLASVTIAQAINESWSGVSYLAQKGNNLFGMKCYLSGNKWKGTTWKGKRIVKKTTEQYGKRVVTITDSFRGYDNVGQSFADHTAYFLNAKNEYGVKRYKGLTNTKSYKKQIAIIMKGGYCTFDIYGQTLIDLIEEYDLTRYDN